METLQANISIDLKTTSFDYMYIWLLNLSVFFNKYYLGSHASDECMFPCMTLKKKEKEKEEEEEEESHQAFCIKIFAFYDLVFFGQIIPTPFEYLQNSLLLQEYF